MKIDPSDMALWVKIGTVAAEAKAWDVSCNAYVRVERSDSQVYRSKCLDGIINVRRQQSLDLYDEPTLNILHPIIRHFMKLVISLYASNIYGEL